MKVKDCLQLFNTEKRRISIHSSKETYIIGPETPKNLLKTLRSGILENDVISIHFGIDTESTLYAGSTPYSTVQGIEWDPNGGVSYVILKLRE